MANEWLSFLSSITFGIVVPVISRYFASCEEGIIPRIADKVVYKAQGFNPGAADWNRRGLEFGHFRRHRK
jgi:hypothetical protein